MDAACASLKSVNVDHVPAHVPNPGPEAVPVDPAVVHVPAPGAGPGHALDPGVVLNPARAPSLDPEAGPSLATVTGNRKPMENAIVPSLDPGPGQAQNLNLALDPGPSPGMIEQQTTMTDSDNDAGQNCIVMNPPPFFSVSVLILQKKSAPSYKILLKLQIL